MNQPIRCEPLPFVKANGEAVAEAPLCTEGVAEKGAEFSDLLQAELEVPEEETTSRETEALAAYGVVPLLLQVIPEDTRPLLGGSVSGDSGGLGEQFSDPVTTEALEAHPARNEKPPESSDVEGQMPLHEELKPLKVGYPPEQKVPSVPQGSPPPTEQISEKTPEPAKKSSGTLVAQPPLMLMTSQTQDESAVQAKQGLGLEHFDVASFEQPIRVEPARGRRMPAEKPAAQELIHLGNELPRMPRLEALTGESALRPVQPVDATGMVEAIRTHVELLRTSSAEKLDVVLRPDAQTELRLQVERVNGQVQVTARCDRGDFAQLEAQWGTIQSALAHQGIKVEALQPAQGGQLQQNGSQQFQNFSGQNSNQREERTPIFIEQDSTTHEASRPRTSRGGAARGWQSWA